MDLTIGDIREPFGKFLGPLKLLGCQESLKSLESLGYLRNLSLKIKELNFLVTFCKHTYHAIKIV